MLNCCNNLNRNQSTSPGGLTEDVTTTVTIGTSPTVVLSANTSRKLIKIYLTSSSTGECWIRYGAGATLANSAHLLPLRYLLIVDSGQAANAISAICSSGTAQLRVSAANSL